MDASIAVAVISDNARNAIITGAACLSGTLFALLLNLENPYWATMTAWSTTALPGRQLGSGRALRQILAAGIGCFVGYNVGIHTEGRPVLQWLTIFLFAGTGTYMRFRSPYYYAWALGSFSSIMLAAFGLYSPSVMYPDAFYRSYEIICGVAGVIFAQLPIAWIVDRVFPRPPGLPAKEPPTMLDRRDAAHIGLVGALTVSIVPVIWYAFALGTGTLLITMIAPLVALDVVFISSPLHTHWRLLGSLLGGLAGFVAASVAADSFFLWSLFLFVGLTVCAWVRGGKHTWSVSGMQLGLAYMFSQVTGSGPLTDTRLVIDRTAGLVLGLFIMIGVAYYVRLFFQDRPVEEMPQRLRLA